MEDKRLSDLLVNIKQLDNGRQRITISYKDEKGDNYSEQYQFEGYLKYFQPDANSVVIQEMKASKDRNYPMIIIFSRLENGHSLNCFCLTDEPIINENLKDIKKMIITLSENTIFQFQRTVYLLSIANKVFANIFCYIFLFLKYFHNYTCCYLSIF